MQDDAEILWDWEIDIEVAEVPEPSTLALLGTGLGALGLAAWRRKKV